MGNPDGPHVTHLGLDAIGAESAAAVEHSAGCRAHRVTAGQCDYGSGSVAVAYCPDCGGRTECPAGDNERN
jgi:hypothetical protein